MDPNNPNRVVFGTTIGSSALGKVLIAVPETKILPPLEGTE